MFAIDPAIPRAALVTGGARRLGRAMAEALAEDGWAVGIHCRESEEEAAGLAASIIAAGGRAAVLPCDLADEAAVADLVQRATEALGPLGCLVNNASVFEMDTVGSATRRSWDAHIEPNLRTPLVLAQAFARQLPEAAEGVVVNMLDQRVWNLT
ncbi:MAG: SDR family NAD(P)-dependent oxidoreductase, partial [Rhodospirillaceae bacterium]